MCWFLFLKAIAMNKVNGTNFLHRLTLAQKEVFPENTYFSVSAIIPSTRARPTLSTDHRSLVGSKSVPPQPKSGPAPPAPYKGKQGTKLPQQKSLQLEQTDGNLDDPPPIPPQRYVDMSSVAPRQKRRGATPESDAQKSRRRHSSIIGSSEYEKAMEKENEKINRVNVSGGMYAVVTKPTNSRPNTPTGLTSPPLPPLKGMADGKEVRRILPKTPSPSAQRRAYAQLEFHNGTERNFQSPNTTPAPAPVPAPAAGLPRDIRTKWDYSTVIFDSDKQREKEFEINGEVKRNKPLPPTPGSNRSSPDLITPQPAPRQRKPQSLTDLRNGGQLGSAYDNVDFSPTTSAQSGGGKREPPRLPPKQESLESYSKPILPPKQESLESPAKPRPR